MPRCGVCGAEVDPRVGMFATVDAVGIPDVYACMTCTLGIVLGLIAREGSLPRALGAALLKLDPPAGETTR